MTTAEAKAFITETIKAWEKAGEDKKITSLAAFAKKWSSSDGGPAKKMKELDKNIKSLESILKRNDKIGADDTFGLKEILNSTRDQYEKMKAAYEAGKAKKAEK